MDVIYQAVTWRRTVTIADDATPVDPDELVAVLCPETPITVTRDAVPVPGRYYVTLTADQTEVLEPGPYHWELFGRIGADTVLLTRQNVTVQATCARFDT